MLCFWLINWAGFPFRFLHKVSYLLTELTMQVSYVFHLMRYTVRVACAWCTVCTVQASHSATVCMACALCTVCTVQASFIYLLSRFFYSCYVHCAGFRINVVECYVHVSSSFVVQGFQLLNNVMHDSSSFCAGFPTLCLSRFPIYIFAAQGFLLSCCTGLLN